MAENNTVKEQETVETPEKTFTQDELNAILGDRLAREREKYADYEVLKGKAAKFDEAEEANKSELQKATERAEGLQKQLDALTKANEVREIREKIASEYNVPVTLLTAEGEDALKQQAEALVEYAKPQTYPQVKDSGEVRSHGSGTTRDQFANWFAENSNIH